AEPIDFLQFLEEQLPPGDHDFHRQWYEREQISRTAFPDLLNQSDFGEFKALYMCFNALPSPAKVHLANSMPVRYANYVGIRNPRQEVVCNRGTSGIDGSSSTAVGCTFT